MGRVGECNQARKELRRERGGAAGGWGMESTNAITNRVAAVAVHIHEVVSTRKHGAQQRHVSTDAVHGRKEKAARPTRNYFRKYKDGVMPVGARRKRTRRRGAKKRGTRSTTEGYACEETAKKEKDALGIRGARQEAKSRTAREKRRRRGTGQEDGERDDPKNEGGLEHHHQPLEQDDIEGEIFCTNLGSMTRIHKQGGEHAQAQRGTGRFQCSDSHGW